MNVAVLSAVHSLGFNKLGLDLFFQKNMHIQSYQIRKTKAMQQQQE